MDTLRMLGYEKLELLHESAGSIVCRARNKQGEIALIKVMNYERPTTEELERFEYEYYFLRDQAVPGVIRVRELIKNYNGHLMILEDNGGIPVADAPIFKSIRKGGRALTSSDLQWILKVFIEMAAAVSAVHARQLIHQDINPSDFLLFDSNQVNLLDLGLSLKLDYYDSDQHNVQVIADVLSYISPEQTGRMDRTIDYRTDFYSLGVSFYELITGQKPFSVKDPLELIHCHIAEMPSPPNALNQTIPGIVSDIIMKLMEKAPEQRYQNASGIMHDLLKCLEQLRISGTVSHFELRANDASSRFQIPQKLYGREEEKERLSQLFQQVSGGAVRILMIGGYSGVGKTSIVQEICRPLAEASGFFACGKTEQFQRNTPYYIFAQVAEDLIAQLLQEPDHILAQWKERLLKSLNGNGRLIVDLVPELAAVIGPQPQVSELGLAENRSRFFYTFKDFLKGFAAKAHPLTLFLDDLQWCDRPSMELIQYLLTCDDLESLVMIGCYRDNELTEGHPLNALLAELRKSDKTVEFPAKPLMEVHIVEMLSEMLYHKPETVQELAGIVHRKSQGNPFFVRKMLLHLYDENYIRFNRTMCQWEWDIKEIERSPISDNIVDLLISQLLKLPMETQEIVKTASLIGSTFDLKTLAAASVITVGEVSARLKKAIEGEIVQPVDIDYSEDDSLHEATQNLSYRFAHDRVQQACADLMDDDQQKKLQLKIGRIIRTRVPREEWAEQAMDIVSHLNEGLDGIETEEERWETARLNLWACRKAKSASAFYLAMRYGEISVGLLPENSWIKDYELTFEIFKTYVECAYLNNDYELAERQVQELLPHAKGAMEQAEIRLMQSTLYNFQGQLDKAVQYAILGLQLLRINTPVAPGMPLLFKEMLKVKAELIGRSKKKLLDLPLMRNEKTKLILQLWNEINRAAYLIGNTNLFLFSILKQMYLTLRFGSNRETGKTYVSYAMILAILGNYAWTYDFCELARMSCEKEQSFESRPTILFSSGFFGHSWNRSWRDLEQWFQASMDEALKYGDHHTIALAGSFMYAFKPDASIRFLVEKAMKQYPLVKQTNNQLSINFTFLMIHRWLNYAGLTDGKFTMSVSEETFAKNGGIGIIFSEEECLEALYAGNFLSALGVYYKEKTYIHYLYNDYEGAMKYLKESDAYLKYHTGTPYIVECRVCSFLVLAANIPKMDKKESAKALGRMQKEYNRVKAWAKHCPVNFEHLHQIMHAELMRISGRFFEAAELYDHGIKTARENGFIRDEALANELAAKMYLEQGKGNQAAFYLTEALKIYELWGADAKVVHMNEKYRHLLSRSEKRDFKPEAATSGEVLDRMSMEKASQAVSNEMQTPDLINQLLKAVVEISGAQKAAIIIKLEQGWKIVALSIPGTDKTDMLPSIPLEESGDVLPTSVINFCIRTAESMLLGDAAGAGRFNKDPYIQKNQIKSLLCVPILSQENQEGILYLENNLATDVFSKDRVQILQILAAQFSISINNVRLFGDLLAKKEEVHQAEEEALRSDIAFLQAQIKPHFLYNAINTISAFSLDDSQMTRDLLAKLSEYLRGSFDFKNRDKLVTLHKELELVEAYLFIEKARFGDRLKVVYHIDENVDCLLPPLMIQPLVENAVHHGLSGRKTGGTVEISVCSEKDDIVITVEDDGTGIDDAVLVKLFEDDPEKSGGVALKNINRRLLQMYGHGLQIERKDSGGTRAVIRITK